MLLEIQAKTGHFVDNNYLLFRLITDYGKERRKGKRGGLNNRDF